MWSLYLVQVMTRVEKNMERKNVLCDPCEKTYLYISALMKPGRFELWTPVTGEFKYMQVRRRPQVFLSVYRRFHQVYAFLSFPFAFKLVYKRKVRCASKADTVHNPVAVIIHCVFYMTPTIYGCSAFWEQRINKQRFCQKIVTSERKANDRSSVIVISVCSQMITYKAVKANSWLRYWLRT